MKYVLYGRVIDSVKDEAVENGMVIVDGERILYAGERNDEMVTDDMQVRDAGNGTIMPGFIDAHAHLTGEESRNSSGTSAFDALLTVVKDLRELVDAGVTGVRANEKSLTGYLMDGPEDCLRGVRQQFRDGAEFIKICATGGVSSAVDNINDVQFSDEELKVIVGEAARHGTYVTAHCTGTAGTLQALKCGVTCIEHGVMLDEECIAIMKEKDIPLVTTLRVALGLADMKNLPDFMMKKAVSVKECAMNSFRMAHEAGIRVALGTDYSNTGNTPFKHIGKEFYSLTHCGYTPMEAIKAGTINGAYLMRKEREIGTLEAGKLADLVIVNGNPLEDILVLADADNISTVMIGGKIVKG